MPQIRSSRALLPLLAGATLIAALANTAQAAKNEPAELAREAPPLKQLPADVRPTRYSLSLEIFPEKERFFGSTVIGMVLEKPQTVIWLHGRDLKVTRVTAESEKTGVIEGTWKQINVDGVACVELPRAVGPGTVTLRFKYDAAFGQRLEGLYRVETGGQSYAFTQFEAISARLAFPGFDEPAFKTPFDITLTVRKDHAAIANTRPVAEEPLPSDRKRIRFATTEKLPTYLVAWMVGPFDVVEARPIPANAVRSRPLPFRGIAVRGQGARLAYALEKTPSLLEALEAYFGIAYPFDKLDLIAVPDYAAGAMENAGAITFRESLLLFDRETMPEAFRRAFTGVTAHEIAHHWFGDLVTMRWWDDVWLNEAFADWIEEKVVNSLYPEDRVTLSGLANTHRAMDDDSRVSARQIRQPIESPHDIQNAFDSITYTKGAAVLAMFERWVGVETFQRGIRLYLSRNRFGNASADDLLAALSEASGKDVGTPLRTFLMQPGVPLVEASLSCHANPPVLRLRQSRYLPVGSTGDRRKVWQIPVCARYPAGKGIRETCKLFSEPEDTLTLDTDSCPAWVIPNADGVGYYRWSLPPEDLSRLRLAGWPALTPRERLSLADSLKAAFAGGVLPATEVLQALSKLAEDENRVVATAPMDLIEFAREPIADSTLRPRVEAFARQLYRSTHERLGWEPPAGRKEDGETKLLRRDVIAFLARIGRDPEVRREAVERARRYLGFGGDGKLHSQALEPDLVGTALAVGVQGGDTSFFQALLQHFSDSKDAILRSRLLFALGSTRDPKLAAEARDLCLDKRLRKNEVLLTLFAQMREPDTRVATWAWLQSNFEQLAPLLNPFSGGSLPRIPATFCDSARADEVERFFAARIQRFPGGPRELAGALESMRLCSAKAAAQAESVRAFFRQTSSGSRESHFQTAPAPGQQIRTPEPVLLGEHATRYRGEPISLDLKDAELKDVLRTFAELARINLVIDPDVKGSVTVRLHDVPWDQALDLILRTNGLGYVLDGPVVRVGVLSKL